jgi:hypothetical protein
MRQCGGAAGWFGGVVRRGAAGCAACVRRVAAAQELRATVQRSSPKVRRARPGAGGKSRGHEGSLAASAHPSPPDPAARHQSACAAGAARAAAVRLPAGALPTSTAPAA